MTERLWAPWRIKYVGRKKQKGCIFCAALKHKGSDLVVFTGKDSLCMLNAFPYNNGHLMVAPRRHVDELSKLKDAEIIDLIRATERAQQLLRSAIKPHAFNIGINLGRDAGAGIAGHLHIHILPRWRGDTNFMPSLFSTKVISQSLEELHKILRKYAKSKSDKRPGR